MLIPPEVVSLADEQPYPLVFATISGAHLYGFPSPDSDFDLRGVHILPARDCLGLDPGRGTIEVNGDRAGLEMDLVTHDVRKFFGLMLKKNGYVLEQLFSPLVVRTTPEHEELKAIGRGCVTRHHVHHYAGFANTQWRLFEKESPRRVKPLLYVQALPAASGGGDRTPRAIDTPPHPPLPFPLNFNPRRGTVSPWISRKQNQSSAGPRPI